MRGLKTLTRMQLLLFFREPEAFFFTLAFPAILLLIMAPIFGRGNEALNGLGGFGIIDMMVPAFSGVIIASVALMGLPVHTASQREKKVLKRFHSSPVRPMVYIISDVAASLITTTAGMLVLVVLGLILFGVRLPANPLMVVAGFLAGALAFYALGYLVAALAPTARVAQVLGNVLFFPMIFLSGATYPVSEMPGFMQSIAAALPMTYLVNLLQAGWLGAEWGSQALEWTVILGLLLVCGVLAARLFRWE